MTDHSGAKTVKMGKIPLLSSSKSSLTILLVLSIVFFLENFDRYLISVSIIPYIDYSSYEYSLISGTLFAVFYSVGAVMITLMGSDLYGSSGGQISSFVMYLTISGVIFSVAFACTALTTTFYQLAIIRIVMGLAQSVVSPYSTGVINLLFNEESRATAFGVFNYGVYLAFSLALSVGTIIYDMYGWKANYLIFGCLGVVFSLSIPFIAYFEHDPPADHGSPGRLSVSHEQLLGSSDDTSPSPAPATRTFNERMAVAWSLFCTILKHCYDHGQWYLLFVLACGLRTGAGYVWVTYTAIYFSELFVGNGDDCSWSYNSATSDNACASDYPYCIDGECQALADTPWHNEVPPHPLTHSPTHLLIAMTCIGIVTPGSRELHELDSAGGQCHGKHSRRTGHGLLQQQVPGAGRHAVSRSRRQGEVKGRNLPSTAWIIGENDFLAFSSAAPCVVFLDEIRGAVLPRRCRSQSCLRPRHPARDPLRLPSPRPIVPWLFLGLHRLRPGALQCCILFLESSCRP